MRRFAALLLVFGACQSQEELEAGAMEARSHGLIEACPPDPAGEVVAYIDHVFIGSRSSPDHTPRPENQKNVYRLNVTDIETGNRTRVKLGTWLERDAGPTCLGIDGDTLWVLGPRGGVQQHGKTDGALKLDTAGLRSAAGVFADAKRLGFDTDKGKLVAETRDGRTHYVSGDLEASEGPRNFANATDITPRRAVTGNAPRVHVDAPQQRWDQERDGGHGHKVELRRTQGRRAAVHVDGNKLGQDFLDPRLLPNDEAFIWRNPDSVIVTYPGSTDAKTWALTRLDLEGRPLLRIPPKEGPYAATNPTFILTKSHIIHFGPDALTAYTTTDGTQSWATPY